MLKARGKLPFATKAKGTWGRTLAFGMRSVEGKVRASSGANDIRGGQPLGMRWVRVPTLGATSRIWTQRPPPGFSFPEQHGASGEAGSAGAPQDNLLGISWVDSSWIPILNSGSVLDYFSERSNPFYDRTCNNEVVKMQRLTLEHLNQMVGVEYILLHAQEPILFIIRKQQRQSPTQVIPLADYYIIAGVIYQAPDLGSVINSRVLTAVHGIQSAFDEAMSYCRYHPSKGYWWHFKDHEEQDKVKPKAKRKEEPSSIFQRQRVDALLLDLRQKFPPKFVQQKSGEKPVPVDQTKKEAEPIPETVKSEEKETTKNVQQIVSTKGPPEKRMRLQ
ncbi:mediator of RNA polymerase II transcription subunit 6 [Puma concolor]|uniref:Mediator of RNA polymerase II transcription subunit 6 n=1 Tax=Puma concolor TaxID=9696 RepID=A0A6P6HH87_PUMCO|nr:mediator of RNA polymerase II transcription subunit 6 [Puma concolor]